MKQKVTVTLDDDHLTHPNRVVTRLRAAGMTVEQVLDNIGIITGTVASERKAALHKVRGVATVESDHSFELAPPDADVQ